jgi:hypothetical protein
VGYFDVTKPGDQFYTDAVGQRAHPSGSSRHFKVTSHRNTSGRMEGAMHDSRRYRYKTAECLLAAQEACQPYYRKLRLSMAASWLSLAQQDEAMDIMLTRWDTAERRISVGR